MLRQIHSDRRLPVSKADFDRLVNESPAIERMWASADMYWLLGGVLFLIYASMLWGLVQVVPGAADYAALAWLAVVCGSIVADYYLFPYYYTV